VTTAARLGFLSRLRRSRVAAATVMSVAEELVIAVCANAAHPGHSAHEGERRQRPDRSDPKILARRTHFRQNSRLTPSKPLNFATRPDCLEPTRRLSQLQRRILRPANGRFNTSLSAPAREPLQSTRPSSIQRQPPNDSPTACHGASWQPTLHTPNCTVPLRRNRLHLRIALRILRRSKPWLGCATLRGVTSYGAKSLR